jgi:MoaA/NifB/PqqE/SkfB family radical SAM enzyme
VEAVKSILRYFHARKSGDAPLFVQLTGGEIFLYPDVFEVISLALDLSYVVRIQTNGTLLDRLGSSEIKIFKRPGIVFKVSIDGWDEVSHGLYRNAATFEKVLSGIDFLRKERIRFGLKTVIHDGNFHELNKMLEFCLKVGSGGWSHNTLMLAGRSKDSCRIDEMSVVKKLVPLYCQNRYKPLLNGNNVLIYYQFAKSGVTSWPPYLYFNFDGELCVTDKIVPERLLGNIHEGRSEEIENCLSRLGQVLQKIDRPIPPDILRFVERHLVL